MSSRGSKAIRCDPCSRCAMSGADLASHRATRRRSQSSPKPLAASLVLHALDLRACSAMPGTDIACAAPSRPPRTLPQAAAGIRLLLLFIAVPAHARAMPSPVLHQRLLCAACYCGSVCSYTRATPCPVLTQLRGPQSQDKNRKTSITSNALSGLPPFSDAVLPFMGALLLFWVPSSRGR